METDRPDQTESSSVVPVKHLQIETGFVFEKDDLGIQGEIQSLALASTLMRYGLTDRFELRLGSEYKIDKFKAKDDESTIQGLNSVDFGTKIFLLEENRLMPETAVLFHLNLPVGSENLVADRVQPSLVLSMSHALTESIGFGYNIGPEYTAEDDLIWFYSAAMGFDIANKLGMFTEIYGDFGRSTTTLYLFDAGFTYLLNNNLQLDTAAGYAFTDEAADWFFNFGVTFRIPCCL